MDGAADRPGADQSFVGFDVRARFGDAAAQERAGRARPGPDPERPQRPPAPRTPPSRRRGAGRRGGGGAGCAGDRGSHRADSRVQPSRSAVLVPMVVDGTPDLDRRAALLRAARSNSRPPRPQAPKPGAQEPLRPAEQAAAEDQLGVRARTRKAARCVERTPARRCGPRTCRLPLNSTNCRPGRSSPTSTPTATCPTSAGWTASTPDRPTTLIDGRRTSELPEDVRAVAVHELMRR